MIGHVQQISYATISSTIFTVQSFDFFLLLLCTMYICNKYLKNSTPQKTPYAKFQLLFSLQRLELLFCTTSMHYVVKLLSCYILNNVYLWQVPQKTVHCNRHHERHRTQNFSYYFPYKDLSYFCPHVKKKDLAMGTTKMGTFTKCKSAHIQQKIELQNHGTTFVFALNFLGQAMPEIHS